MLSSKMEKIVTTYEIKEKNSNYIYNKQLTSLTQVLDNAKNQITLMQNYIKKQNEISLKTTVLEDDLDDILLNM
jgi:hypothetical protein